MKKSIITLAAVLAALILVAFAFACGKGSPSGGDSLREVSVIPGGEPGAIADTAGIDLHDGHDHYDGPLVDPNDPYADEVREYLRTGIARHIPRTETHFELPYLGPIITRGGEVIDRFSFPGLDLAVKVESDGELEKSASKVQLPNPKPASVGVCKHVFILSESSANPQAHTAAAVNEKIFGSNSGRTCPSLRDFYAEMSYGKLDIQGAVYPQTGAYRSNASPFTGPNQNLNMTFVNEILSAANNDINFAEFDGNNDGVIDALTIVIFYSGGRAFVQHGMSGSLDGKQIRSLGILFEDDLNPESRVAHHEMGHFLKLPDYYDYGSDSAPPSPGPDGNESMGVGYWDLMGAGNFTNPPMHMSPYNKWLLNWIEPNVITSDVQDLVLVPSNIATNSNSAYILWTEGTFNREFFIIENRWQVANADFGPNPGQGLLIWHVDENEMISPSSGYGVNDIEEHKALDLEEADGRADLDRMVNYGDAGDVYPNSDKDFSFTSNPNSRNYAGEDSLVKIFNIRKDTGTKTITIDASVTGFTFNMNNLSPFTTSGTTNIEPTVNDKVNEVQIYLNGGQGENLVYDSNTPPFIYPWDTGATLFGQFTIKAVGTGTTEDRTILQDILVDNMPSLFPLADNAEAGFFQFFPLSARYPSPALKSATRKVAGTPEEIAGEMFGEWRQRVDWKTSGERSFYVGMGSGSYANFQNDFLVSRKINLSGVATPTLSFSHQYDIELNKDFARVLVTDDDGRTFTQLAEFTGTLTNTREVIPFESFSGKTVRIVFFFESDGSGTDNGAAINGSGWWIDDIAIANGAVSSLPSVQIITPTNNSTIEGTVNVVVAVSGAITKVDYIVYHTSGSFTFSTSNPPYGTPINTAMFGNQRVIMEARAIGPSGLYTSDIRTLDVYNLIGDTNGDKKVDEADIELIRTHYGKKSTHADYRIWLDCNGDGEINEMDAALIGYNFGKTL